MPGKPPGSVVGLYVDSAERVDEGDIIKTGTGRRYRIITVKVQESGRNIGRQHLGCVVMHPDDPDGEGKVVEISWYTRRPRSRAGVA